MFKNEIYKNFKLKYICQLIVIPIAFKSSTFNNFKDKLYCAEKNLYLNDRLESIETKLAHLIELRRGPDLKKEFPKITNNTLLAKLITPQIYKKYKNIKTKEGYVLDDVIQAGIDNPYSIYTLVSPSEDAYLKFADIFNNYFKLHFAEDLSKNFENESYSMIKSLIPGMEEIIKEYFIEIDITTHRNLNNFSFTPKMSRNERNEVKEILYNVLLKLEFDIFKHKGKFNNFRNDQEFKNNFEEFFKSIGIYRDWPENRLIYLNELSRLMCIINEEDHLKIKLNSTNPLDMGILIQNYFDLLENLESDLDFSLHKNYGFLNTFPSNVGTGTYFILKLKISADERKNEEIIKKFKESQKDLVIEINKIDESSANLIIRNTNPFYTFSTLLVELIGTKEYFK